MASKKIGALDAELLLAHACAKPRSFILAHPEIAVGKITASRFKKFIARRKNHEPMHYILGRREFYGRVFKISRPILIPRPETEHLVEALLEKIPASPAGAGAPDARPAVFDIGCGSGAVGITIALERPEIKIFMSDIDARAARLAKKNALSLNLRPLRSFGARRATIKKGGFFAPWKKELAESAKSKTPIFIAANLPYLSQKRFAAAPPEVKKYESKNALLGNGPHGLNIYFEFFIQLANICAQMAKKNMALNLKCIAIEIDPEQVEPLKKFVQHLFDPNAPAWAQKIWAQTKLAQKPKQKPKIEIKKDLAQRDRVFILNFSV